MPPPKNNSGKLSSTKPSKSKSEKSGHGCSNTVVCKVCEEEIVDASPGKKGQDAVYCEGACSAWLHRVCASLSKSDFQVVSKSKDKFSCYKCRLTANEQSLLELKKRVGDLESKMDLLMTKNVTNNLTQEVGPRSYAEVADSESSREINLICKQQNQNSRSLEQKFDRKFNVIVHGVEESAEGKPRFMRQKEDTDKVCGVFSQLVENITHQAIRDQFRLGKFNPSATRPRPILVKLIRSADVSEILSKAHELSHPIQVKPDKSPAEREKYKCLMGVRWALINSGIDRKQIKIKGPSLFVDDALLGKVNQKNSFVYEEGKDDILSANNSILPTGNSSHSPPLAADPSSHSDLQTPAAPFSQLCSQSTPLNLPNPSDPTST